MQVLLVPQWFGTVQHLSCTEALGRGGSAQTSTVNASSDERRALHSLTSFSDLVQRQGSLGTQNNSGTSRRSSSPPSSVARRSRSDRNPLDTSEVPRSSIRLHFHQTERGSASPPHEATTAAQFRDLRLCLAFAQQSPSQTESAWTGAAPSPTHKQSSNSPQLSSASSPLTLVTPVSHEMLLELTRWQPCLAPSCTVNGRHSSVEDSIVSTTSGGPVTQKKYGSCHGLLKAVLLRWRDRGAEGTPEAALLAVILLFTFDILAFILADFILFKTSTWALLVRIFIPPLVQPVAVTVGCAFLLTEVPWLGRLFASLELFGIVNSAVTLVVLTALLEGQSLIFNFVSLISVAVAKAVLFAAVSAHVVNLEAARDLSYMTSPQADFLGRILSGIDPQTQTNPADHHDEDRSPGLFYVNERGRGSFSPPQSLELRTGLRPQRDLPEGQSRGSSGFLHIPAPQSEGSSSKTSSLKARSQPSPF